MVAIRSHEADRFLARDAAGFSVYLVFGTDMGLVGERVRTVLRALVDDPSDGFQVTRLRGDDVSAEPGRLADEVDAVPMFGGGGRRAVLVEGTGRDLVPALTHQLGRKAPTPVVVEGGALKKDAAIRKLVERSREAVAIECYPDEERDVARLIDAELAAAGLTIGADARASLAGSLGADRMASRGEIAKLALYAHGRPEITVDDVEAVVADAAAQATDALIDATFAGDLRALDAAARRVLTGSVEAGTLLGAILRHAVWLHRARLDIDAGGSPDAALASSGRAGIAPRRRDAVSRQLRAWRADPLGETVMRLGDAIGRVRREPVLAIDIAWRTLWTIARVAGRGQGAA